MRIGDGKHNAAHREAVEIVVDEDQHAQSKGGQSGTCTALDMGLCPFTEGGRRTGLIDQRHENSQQNEENKDTGTVGNGGNQTVVDNRIHRIQRTERGCQKTAGQNADEQRGIHFLGNQRQTNGDNRGNDGPKRPRKAGGFSGSVGGKHRDHGNQDHHREDRNQR